MFEKENVLSGSGTIVGANVKLTGTLKDMNDITIHGQVEGEVICEKNVLVTETAYIKGPISAKIVTISGKVNGSVEAKEKLEITPTGKVYGSVSTKDLIIRSGAVFVGKSSMLSEGEIIQEKSEKVVPKKIKEVKNKEVEKKEEKEEEKKMFWKVGKDKESKKTEEPKYELE